ncbi:retrovirus-related Pol polyprotein from transposon 412 [Trichonephila clavipes]|nr:retrovirus-related Pol polyprotein from transposon 412 [Trichonephila clavipes]
MCEGLQQTPAEVTAAESVRNAQELATDVERLSHLAFSDCPTEKADGKKTLKCWTCGREGHLQRSCRARQGAETNKRLPEGGVGKLINDHLVGRRLPDFGKPHIPVCQISTKSTDRDGEKIDIHGKLKVKIQFGDTTYQHAVYVADIADPFILGLDFLKEHGFTLDFNKNECVPYTKKSLYSKLNTGQNLFDSFNSGLIGTAENKANGLLIASTLVDLSRKTIPVRICNVTEKPRVFQKGEVLTTCSPVTCVCKSSSLLLSNSPQQLTPDLLENAELSPEQKSSAERLFQEFEDVFSRNSSDIGHTTVTQHRIDTADHPPIKQHPRRLPFAKQEEVGTLLREMQENDIRHRKGSSHGNADALSRRPCPENCRHCSRVETKYDYAIRQITTSTATPPDPWSDEKVREDQMADPDIKPLIEFMESSSNKPSWQDISAYSPTTKQYWALWNSLHLRNGVLYRKFESEDGKTFRWQLVLPRSRIPEVLKELHGSPTGGHFGVMKTLHRVRERFCWGKVRADVEQWCKSCDACSARKGPKIRSRGKLHRYNVGAPFERIAFDILGPLPRTASGNKYLLVVIDYFTKWPEVYPIPDQEAPTVAEAVVQHWISRYGVPLQLHSDQGRNFVSAVLKGVCELLGIDKTKTTPLHPHVRSAVHETTGYSPSQMLFGRDLRLPCDLLFGRPPDTPSSPEEYVQNLQARFEDVHNLARERINLRTEKMKTRCDTKATGHQFKEGDKVWFYNPTRRKGLSPKLQSHWDGPYTILKIINDVVIRIRKSTNSKPRVVHYDRLAPYYGHNS